MKILDFWLKNTRKKSSEIDTIVYVSSDQVNFEQISLKEHHCYKIQISHKMKDTIKYLAMYESAPVSAIRYIVKVKAIKSFENSSYAEIMLS